MNDYEYDEKALPPAEDDITSEDYEEVSEEEKVSDEYYELPGTKASRSMIWSIISTVLGVLSIPGCGFYVVGITLSVLSIGSAMFSRYRLGYFDKWSVFGLIFGIMGAVCGFFALAVTETGILNHV